MTAAAARLERLEALELEACRGLEAQAAAAAAGPPSADGTAGVPCRANLSTPRGDISDPSGARPKGAPRGRGEPANPDMVCFRPGCENPVKRRDRKFCCQDCASEVTRTARVCEVCRGPLASAQRRNGQRTCSRKCGAIITPRQGPKRSEEFREKVRRLWCDEKLSDKEIGERLGVSKNVIVGVRRRMPGMPIRPTQRWPEGYVPQVSRPKMEPRTRPPSQRKRRKLNPTKHGTSPIKAKIAAVAVKQASPIHVVDLPGNGCQFPTSENPWRICDQPRVPHPDKAKLSPYCSAHYGLCFTTARRPQYSLHGEAYFAHVNHVRAQAA